MANESGGSAPDFTKGPWEAVFDGDQRGQPVPYYRGLVCVIERNPERHVSVVATGGEVPAGQWRPNAQLIAAAPDLYAALADIVDDPHSNITIGALERGRAALAKARGEAA